MTTIRRAGSSSSYVCFFTKQYAKRLRLTALLFFFWKICLVDHRLPAPVNLSYTWLDPFVVQVTWSRPRHLPDNCSIEYAVSWQSKEETVRFGDSRVGEIIDVTRWLRMTSAIVNLHHLQTYCKISLYCQPVKTHVEFLDRCLSFQRCAEKLVQTHLDVSL